MVADGFEEGLLRTCVTDHKWSQTLQLSMYYIRNQNQTNLKQTQITAIAYNPAMRHA